MKEGGRKEGWGREKENLNLFPHRIAIKEHMYQLKKKFLGNESFLIEHSLFSQLM